MALTPIPKIDCGLGTSAVIVRAYRVLVSPLGLESPPIMISGAEVKYRAGLSILAKDYNAITNSLGIASYCIPINAPLEVSIRKPGEDFGSGKGQWKKLNVPFRFASVSIDAKSTEREAIPTPVAPPAITPPAPLPCTGNFTQPNMSSLLAGITTPPSSLFVPVGLTGGKTTVPVEIWVSGTRVATQPTGFTGFDLIKMIREYYSQMGRTPNFTVQHNITIKSTATDCNIPSITIPIPALSQAPVALPGCPQLATTIDSVNHPAEITDFNSTFYVYLRGIKEICKSDPTNPAFISKLPKGTKGTITLGNLSTDFYLTDDGISDIDLSKLINLPSLAGVTGGITPQPVAVIQPTAPSVAGERVGSYCTLKPFVMSGQTFYDVIHDTIGKIYGGNTYDQAKYKAGKDERCFPKVALPCVTITIWHKGTGRNAVIGFRSTVRGSRYAEGSQSWGWGGNPAMSDADYMKNIAIPQTMSYLNIKREEICNK